MYSHGYSVCVNETIPSLFSDWEDISDSGEEGLLRKVECGGH